MHFLYYSLESNGMYRRAQFFKISYPLRIDEIKSRLRGAKNAVRTVNNKNFITQKIDLKCDFEHKKETDGNYLLGISLEYQIRIRQGMEYQKARDLFAFIFFPKDNILVVLGRDTARSVAVTEVSKILYPDVEDLRMLSPITFSVGSMVAAITQMRDDDPSSWCDEYRGRHDGQKYQGKKTKSNFSLGEGLCIFDDSEAKDAIDKSTSISPKYKFFACPKLNQLVYDTPKTISFNGQNGVVSVSIYQEFENWYKFISEFLIKILKFEF